MGLGQSAPIQKMRNRHVFVSRSEGYCAYVYIKIEYRQWKRKYKGKTEERVCKNYGACILS